MDWFKSSRGKKTEDYEKDYLTRYKKGEKSKPKKKALKQKSTEEKSDEIKQKNEIETRKDESEPLSTKFESAKQEYSLTIKNLMNAKKFKKWHSTFWENLKTSIKLHRITKLIVINHKDCGAAKIVNGKKKFIVLHVVEKLINLLHKGFAIPVLFLNQKHQNVF